jgi:chromosome segregation ATPase
MGIIAKLTIFASSLKNQKQREGRMLDQKKKSKIRIIVAIALGALTVYTLVLWYSNYHMLERSLAAAERSADDQARNFRHYIQQYRITKSALDEANQKVYDLTMALQSANAELFITRGELSSVQTLNDQLKESIGVLETYKVKAMAKGEALGSMINAFKKKNKQLDADLQMVRKELSGFKPDIMDTKEGREKVLRFKNQIKLVKKNMVILKEQAQVMKVAAQQQRDRLEALYGNNGYMMKDGKDQSLKRESTKVDIKVEFK